ncbi:MAG: transglycosylase domain-containing protein [Acidimicrobiia bacterium]
MVRKGSRFIAAFLVISVLTPIVCVAVALGTLILLPLPATLPTPKAGIEKQISRILDATGAELATVRQFETNIKVEQSEIPQVLKDAVVSSEDKDFYSHGGIDFSGTVRALWADIRNRAIVEGGSTITQQYVKQAFTGGERSLARKIREAILANQLDNQVDKDTILYRYLSISYFGAGAYGVGAAAQTYFRKPVAQLSASEAALLASVLPAPTRYDPRTNPSEAEARRFRVLGQMREQGRLDAATYEEAISQRLWLVAEGEPPPGTTLVYPPEEQQSVQPWFTDYVVEYLRNNLPDCDGTTCEVFDRGGLTIRTTLDPHMQAEAEAAVAESMGENDLRLQMGLASVEPSTGYVRAMVGGRDYSFLQVNTARAGRQPGSAYKPFVLAAALEQGIGPEKAYSGSPCQLPNGDVIRNYGGASYGSLSLRQGTWNSVNAVYCRLILDVGVEKTMEMATRLGVPQPAYDPSVFGASISLGVTNASPLNMASAFGVFANHGRRAEPVPVIEVTDIDGNVILDNNRAAERAEEVLPPIVADNVTDILTGVIESGTARGKGLARPAAGKTGTAEDAANAWFVGYTPALSTAVWIGYYDCGASDANRDCGLRGINGIREMTGGALPAATWQRYMRAALADIPATEFSEPVPIKDYADAALRALRGGFDPGPPVPPISVPPDSDFLLDLPPPTALPPTTPPPTTSSTSTTRPLAPSTTVPGLLGLN